jgi:SAM-dependent methyltransferase
LFSATAELYDSIYFTIKDYPAESEQIARRLRAEHPSARTILDVACGTGEHFRLLTSLGFEVDGLDLDPNLLRIAAAKNPAGRFYHADMSAFSLGRTYDVVLCLGSSIGYVRTLDHVIQTLQCFRRHLSSDGLIMLEPWFTPDAMIPGYTTSRTFDSPAGRVVRNSQTTVTGRISRLLFEYEIHGSQGIRHASEVHELGLFTREEMLGAFTQAGFRAAYEEPGLTGRGLYVARVVL